MSSYGMYSKLLKFDRTPEEANDSAHEQVIEETVAGLEVIPSGNVLSEDGKIGNTWTLGGGVYPSFIHKGNHNSIRGVAANSIISRGCQINGHSSVVGVTFNDGAELGAQELVRIGPGAAVSFVNCTFRRDASSTNGIIHVSYDGPGTVAAAVVFVGCTFVNGGAVTILNGSGVATKAQTVGCVNLTGNATLGPVGTITETGTVSI